MRISITKSKNYEFLYVTRDIYNNGKRTTKVHEKLGKVHELCEQKNMTRDELIDWARKYAKDLTDKENSDELDIVVPFVPSRIIDKNVKRNFNCGYLFLQKLYYQLRLNSTCRNIKSKYKYNYDLNAILSDLIYSRILQPASKKSSYDFACTLLETPSYELHDVYRALDILSKESDYIQNEIYRNSHFVKERNTGALYYDCTNYYFEIEEDDGFRMYGKSKENRPNPIVGMGLMMDGDGIPLAFSTYEGNKNEQVTLKPLEERIIKDFNLSKFIYCSDAGLASKNNKMFNSIQDRAYIITQSLKKLKKDDKEVALKSTGFRELGVENSSVYDLNTIDFSIEANRERVFYKEIPLEKPMEERLIITFSPKYAVYQRKIRDKQVERCKKMISDKGKFKKNRNNPSDPARFLERTVTDENGEIIEEYFNIDQEKIDEEAKYDGLYAVTTNLEDDDVSSIVKVSERRWQIEECFRIMKTDFKARPVYVSTKQHIEAHFLTCFIALIIYRLLADKLENKYTVSETLETLRGMNMIDTQYNRFIPAYERTSLTDALHDFIGFRTDYEIITKKKMRNNIKLSKEK